ncbi:MAG: hypothetical protein A2031_05850 [Deltaproteobacteria bacterium RBG_19FT_COMBO_43_11]|nr:MAG: hypothetical protein A2W27_07140 [Deltaproteobacteria bacterium RBG_16_44_11]OGP91107.1 MAG: hypothetical protein A2031_05850 [Deltaproteobacteria bacterium RBG_19FT_COMBO_43_11]
MAKRTKSTASKLKSKISKPQSLRILMVEDSEDDVLLIIRELKKGGYDPVYERVETATAMKKALKEKQWDIILCDYTLPKFSVAKAIALLKETNIDIPFILVTGSVGEEVAVECMRLGAHDYIMKNNLSRLCLAIAGELEEADSRNKRRQAESQREAALEALRETDNQLCATLNALPDLLFDVDVAGTIYNFLAPDPELLYAPPSEFLGKTMKEVLSPEAGNVISEAIAEAVKTGRHSGGVYPLELPSGRCWFELSIAAKDNSNLQNPRFIMLVRDITARKEAEEKIQLLNAKLEQMALTDYLTNLYNRRYFMQRGVEEFKRANRNSQPLTLLMLDIDEFKKVNDTYGHEAGDLVLQQVAASLKSSLREIDILGRLGGEEFAVLLPNTSLEGAVLLAERVRQTIANMSFKTPGDVLISTVTISIGVAAFTDEMSNTDDLLRNADAAMYCAKDSGRNCVGVYKENSDGPRVLPSALDVK